MHASYPIVIWNGWKFSLKHPSSSKVCFLFKSYPKLMKLLSEASLLFQSMFLIQFLFKTGGHLFQESALWDYLFEICMVSLISPSGYVFLFHPSTYGAFIVLKRYSSASRGYDLFFPHLLLLLFSCVLWLKKCFYYINRRNKQKHTPEGRPSYWAVGKFIRPHIYIYIYILNW